MESNTYSYGLERVRFIRFRGTLESANEVVCWVLNNPGGGVEQLGYSQGELVDNGDEVKVASYKVVIETTYSTLTLHSGEYLVRYSDGTFARYSAKGFNETFTPLNNNHKENEMFNRHHKQLARDKDQVRALGFEYTVEGETLEEAPTVEATDPVNPKHYQNFSNGAEVIDITENLTFNGGNAVKYITRATRLDGQNKGEVLDDLHKARWYINREIERLNKGAL